MTNVNKCQTTNNGGDEEQWVAGPDDATHIVWAYSMFF